MRLFRGLLLLSLIIYLSGITSSAIAQSRLEKGKDNSDRKTAPDRILVKFNRSISENAGQQINAKYKLESIETIPKLNVHVIKVPNGKLLDMLKNYRSERFVAYAEPDFVVRAFEVPNDPYFSKQWAISSLEITKAWDITHSQAGIRIAILDSGIDTDHKDLAGKIVARKNFTSSMTVDDRYGHGTHTAGIAAAITNNGTGVAGCGYNCSLMNVKVLNDSGSGYNSWIAKGIVWAADNGAKVINVSLGSAEPSSVLEDAVNYAWNKNVVVIAAAGNNSSTTKSYPAAYDNCIAVTAIDSTGNKANFSTYGSWVDIAAPGVNIFSTLPNHRHKVSSSRNYGYMNGTSMAAPFVSGLAGLMWSTSYGVDNASIRNRIEETTDKTTVGNIYSSYGVPCINYYKSMAN